MTRLPAVPPRRACPVAPDATHRRRSARRGLVTLATGVSLLGALALGGTHAVAAAPAAPLASAAPAPAASAAPAPAASAAPASAASPTTGTSSRAAAFMAAAREFGVPVAVLEAVSFSESRWEAHDGEHNTDGGYGPMSLVDGTLFGADRAEGRDGTRGGPGSPPTGTDSPDSLHSLHSLHSLDSLGRAAALLGLDRQVLRASDAANIRGGAALIAARQRALGLPAGEASDPGQWYAAVADASHATTAVDAAGFADDVYAVLATGAARTTADGKSMTLPATRTIPQKAQLSRLRLTTATAGARAHAPVDCPSGLGCTFVPAPYEDLGNGSYGNHDLAQRYTTGPKIDYIVIHDTEASYATTLQLVQDPTYVSWNYTVRSSDGHVAQHVDNKDVAWHAGNWYVNTHSIGIEHEGFAPQGATWFTEAMYRTSARLVSYLTTEYNIPVDRAHILGHDQVPGVTPDYVAGMHWDPGPYWDWEHYFALLGHPLSTVSARPSAEIVRILPGFAGNRQPVTDCDDPDATTPTGARCPTQGTNFVYLRTSPSDSAPLVADVGRHPDGSPSTYGVSDISARATAGTDYAVAARQGSWTAIWYLGDIAWFKNPATHPTAINVPGSYVVPKKGLASVPVYGRAYPEASAFPSYIPVQTVTPLQYTVKAGQRVVLTDARVSTDYYRASTFDTPPPTDHVLVTGLDVYYEVDLGHRIAYVRAADVDVRRAR